MVRRAQSSTRTQSKRSGQANRPAEYFWLSGLITNKTTKRLADALVSLEVRRKSMVLFIDSLGGCPRAALTIHDMIRSSRSNVVGLVTGQCLSAAVLVFQACDWRGMLPNASMMLHQGTVGGDVTPASEFKSAVRQEIKEFNKFDELVVKRSELDERTYKKLNYTGRYLSADEAVKLKLADEVVHKR